jgi:5'-3' exonuclease
MSPNAIIEKQYKDLKHTVLGVDVYSYLYPSQYNAAAKGKGSHIRNFMDMILNFNEVNIRLVFVFDGKTYSEDKKATIDSRIERRNDVNTRIMEIMGTTISGSTELKGLVDQFIRDQQGTVESRDELRRLIKRQINITSKEIEDLVTLFDMTGAPYFQAKGEADFLLASMYEDKLISGVVSEDKDMLTHGVGRLISGLIDANCRRAGTVMEYNLDTILEESKLTMPQFIDFCILSGCDYGAKISGVAAGKGLQFIKKYGDINGIIVAMKANHISYRPDLTMEEYEKKYKRAYSIFYERQECVTDIEAAALIESFRYCAHPELQSWLAENTNYTGHTISKKLLLLQPEAKPKPIKIKISIKPRICNEAVTPLID